MTSANAFVGVPHRRLAALLAAVEPRSAVEPRPAAETRGGRAPAADPGGEGEGSGVAGNDRDAVETAFARVALGTMVEPGDTDAGALVGALGPAEALRCLVAEHDAGDLLARIGADASSARQRSRMSDALKRWRSRGSPQAGVRALEMAAHVGATLLTPESAGWPAGLAALDAGAPISLWLRGDPRRLAALDRSISLVGARAATGYGEHVAMESAAGLGDRGFAIVSGGAYGIDGAAHRAAVASGHVTVAFLAGGVDRLYPAGHSDLLRRVAEDGLLLGELPCGSTPTRWRFLMRNRLIAAVSGATVVIEAGHRSGSLNTAGHPVGVLTYVHGLGTYC